MGFFTLLCHTLNQLAPQLKDQAVVYAVLALTMGSAHFYNANTYAKTTDIQGLAVKIDSNYLEKSIEDNQRELWALLDKDEEGTITRNEKNRMRTLQALITKQSSQLSIINASLKKGASYDF